MADAEGVVLAFLARGNGATPSFFLTVWMVSRRPVRILCG